MKPEAVMRYLGITFLVLGLISMPASADEILDFELRPLLGVEPVNLKDSYGGKVILVVNTASKCGFTPQYEGLQKLYEQYKARDFVVLGFPSGDFAGQELAGEEDIAEFCRINYGVEFPMFEKISVTGSDAHPFYRRLTSVAGEVPQWNFHKYLLDRQGRVVAAYNSRVTPNDRNLIQAIENAL
jgi:glutathione peroxidase